MKRYCIVIISIVWMVAALPVQAARLVPQIPARAVYEGDSVVLDWNIDTEQQSINVADITVQCSNGMRFVGAQTGTSPFIVWPTPPQQTVPGTIHAVGALPSGVQGNTLSFMRTTFTTQAEGDSTCTAQGTVFAADGNATPITLTPVSITVPVLPMQSKRYILTSLTHPDQTVWYKTSNISLQFSVFPQEQYKYSLSTDPGKYPDTELAQHAKGTVTYTRVPDGLYYFRVASKAVQGAQQDVWQDSGMYTVRIDATPPHVYDVAITPQTRTKGIVTIFAVDKMSGIASYQSKKGIIGLYQETFSGDVIQRPLFSDTVYIKVTDYAGNSTIVKTYYRPLIPQSVSLVLIVLCIVGIVRYTLQYKKRSKKHHAKKV